MKKLIFLIPFVIFSLNSFAQRYNVEKVNKKAIASFQKGNAKVEEGRPDEAIGFLDQAIKEDKGYLDAYLLLASIYSERKQYANSSANYEIAFSIDSFYSFEYKLPFAISLAGTGNFEKALEVINSLLAHPEIYASTRKEAERRKKSFEFAIELNKKNAARNYVFNPVNAGDGVNTSESEYWPMLTLNGKELVFTRRLRDFNEDFFSSIKTDKGWDVAQPLKGNINTFDNEAAQNISVDGEWLVFTANNRRDGFGGFDIYMSYLTPQGWSEPVNLGPNVNSDQWDSQPSLSPDKRQLYFASRRPGGYGGSDIYVSTMQNNGRWGPAVNLGPSVNTPLDDQCPFMHADNQTLYFTSNGWPGYGDADIFYVRRGPKGVWSDPVNLGYPINTISQDGTLFITADGKTAYYSSDRGEGKGRLDIYSFELREDLRPFKTLWVTGQVFDSKTKKGLPSAVELTDLTNNEVLSRVQTDEDGNYIITLPVGKNYAFNVNRKGYLFYSDNFLLANSSPDSTYEKNIPLIPIEANAVVILNNIFFDVNRFELKNESQVELDKLVQLLNENPSIRIEIGGHTDNTGKPADNLLLSNNRAKAVITYLVSKGISPQRLIAKGYGETKPVAPNTTEEGKARNRRTELKVIGN